MAAAVVLRGDADALRPYAVTSAIVVDVDGDGRSDSVAQTHWGATAEGGDKITTRVHTADGERLHVQTPRGTVDLLGIGPFRATPTKPDAAQPLGLDGVGAITDAARAGGFANVVIGGVKLPDLRALVAAGAQGVAVVSAICGQPDPLAATQALRRELDAAGGSSTGSLR